MNTAYILIPSEELTQAMINRSVNRKLENIRSNIPNTLKIIEVEFPVPSIYDNYQWYSRDEIYIILSGEDW